MNLNLPELASVETRVLSGRVVRRAKFSDIKPSEWETALGGLGGLTPVTTFPTKPSRVVGNADGGIDISGASTYKAGGYFEEGAS